MFVLVPGGMAQLVRHMLATWTSCQRLLIAVWYGRLGISFQHCLRVGAFEKFHLARGTVTKYSCQVALQTGAGLAKITGLKPKLFMTAAVKLPPNTWTKVS